jgi:hypothetical protein
LHFEDGVSTFRGTRFPPLTESDSAGLSFGSEAESVLVFQRPRLERPEGALAAAATAKI